MEAKAKSQGDLIKHLKSLVNNLEKETSEFTIENFEYEASTDRGVIENVTTENSNLRDEQVKMELKQMERLSHLQKLD